LGVNVILFLVAMTLEELLLRRIFAPHQRLMLRLEKSVNQETFTAAPTAKTVIQCVWGWKLK